MDSARADGNAAAATSFYARVGKRAFDVAVGSFAFVLLSPILLIAAVLVRASSRGPVLFRQERLGKSGRVFAAYKFRTMVDKPRVPDTIAYSGDPSEITLVGGFLRRTKLDELPQIINVMRGEMSVVGPRPQLPKQRSEFDRNAELRLLVRPGLTGLAQVNGNTALSWPERWYYDAEYVKHISLGLDCRIIAKTIAVLLHGEERFTRKPGLQ